MKNIETPDKMHLGKLVEEIRYGKYVIPDFQRDFVWEPWDVADLIRSVFEDYYIGTMLFWKAGKENQKLLSCEPIYGFEGKAEPDHIVLDGQQRLSAIYYALFAPQAAYPRRKSRCFFFIGIDDYVDEKYEDAFYYEWNSKNARELLENKELQFKKKIFPLSVIGKSSYSWIEWLHEYKDYWQEKGESNGEIEKFENALKELMNNYDVSFIELDRQIEVSKVCDIFTRINSTGVDLSIFDLLNAMLRPKDIFLKNMWNQVSDKFGIVRPDKMRIYILQTMSILKQGYCSPKYLYYLVPEAVKRIKKEDGQLDEKVLVKNNEDFVESWDFAVEKTKKTVELLENPREYGAIKPKYLPYPTMIPILTALYIEKDKDIYKDKNDVEEKIKKWYWSSIFTKNYSSSVESQMAKDYKDMKAWFKDDTKLPRIVERFYNEINSIDLFNETNSNSAIYKAIFNLLVIKGAKDWENLQLPESSELEDHHIVPRSWGKRNAIYNIDSILNRTPISNETNRNVIKDRLPKTYISELFKKSRNKDAIRKILGTHYISKASIEVLMSDGFSVKHFDEFLKERNASILEDLKETLDVKDVQKGNMLEPDTPYSNRLKITNILKRCRKYLYWYDRYFSKVGLELLSGVADEMGVTDIKILASVDKVSESLKDDFKHFRKEMENNDKKVSLRVLVDNTIKGQIHDRWIITQDIVFNIPSTDTVAAGQYSEIKETDSRPPFEEWWKIGLDILGDWGKIEKFIKEKAE